MNKMLEANNQLLIDAMNIRLSSGLNTTSSDYQKLYFSSSFGNIEILKGTAGQAVGYIAFANANKESVRKTLQFLEAPNYRFEYNEGNYLLLLDIVILKQYSRYGSQLLKKFLKNRKRIIFYRKNRSVIYIKKEKTVIKKYFYAKKL